MASSVVCPRLCRAEGKKIEMVEDNCRQNANTRRAINHGVLRLFRFGNLPPISWANAQVPTHGTDIAKPLNNDIQDFRPHLEGVHDDGFCITNFFDTTSDNSRELVNFGLASFRTPHLTIAIQWHTNFDHNRYTDDDIVPELTAQGKF